jgi:hypothetical protein
VEDRVVVDPGNIALVEGVWITVGEGHFGDEVEHFAPTIRKSLTRLIKSGSNPAGMKPARNNSIHCAVSGDVEIG